MTQTEEERKRKASEYHKNYYKIHRDEIRKRVKGYQEEHRDEINAKHRERGKVYYRENRDICLERSRKYNETHHDALEEKKKISSKIWKDTHRDEIREYRRKYFIEHHNEELENSRIYGKTPRAKENNKRYRDTHREYVSNRNKNWRENNREYDLERQKKWHKDNPERFREYARKRRALLQSAPGRGITSAQEKEIFEQYNYHCAYCGIGNVKLEIDHIEPLARGGADDIENATASCRPCNISKKNKTLLRFLYDRHKYINLTEEAWSDK